MCAAQQRIHAADELHHAEGLRQVIVGARIEPADGVVFGPLRRQHHHGERLHGGIVADHAKNLKPVGAGQHDVEQNQVGNARLARRKELVGLGKALSLETRLLERIDGEIANVDVVLNVVDHRWFIPSEKARILPRRARSPQTIPHAAHRLDEIGVLAELLAKREHVGVHRAASAAEIPTPHVLQQRLARQDDARVLH